MLLEQLQQATKGRVPEARLQEAVDEITGQMQEAVQEARRDKIIPS